MLRRIGLLMLVAACLAMAASAAEKNAGPSTVGTWKLDAAKSSFGSMPAPKAEMLVVANDSLDAIRWNMMSGSATGTTYFSSYDGPIDGQQHPMHGSAGSTMIAYTRSGPGLEWVVKDKSGNVIETASRSLSPDGKIMTIKGTTKSANGDVAFVSVFDKVK